MRKDDDATNALKSECDAEALIRCEQELIEAGRDRTGCAEWTGIGLSGGGIRAATFCLGALQAMASKDVLKAFDYISSVSGGGYTSAALQWHWRNAVPDESGSGFPYGNKLLPDYPPKRDLLSFLRGHARYLTPGREMTFWSLPAVIFRTIFLNLFVWIPLCAAAFIALFGMGVVVRCATDVVHLPLTSGVVFTWLQQNLTSKDHVVFALLGEAVVLATALSAFFALVLLIFGSIVPPERTETGGGRAARVMITAILTLIGVGLIWIATIMASTFLDGTGGSVSRVVQALRLPLILALVFVVSLQTFGSAFVNAQYRARRFSEIYGGKILVLITLLSLIAVIPFLEQLASLGGDDDPKKKGMIGVASAVTGLVTGIYGHVSRGAANSFSATKYVVAGCAGVFLYSIAVLAYLVAKSAVPNDEALSKLMAAIPNDAGMPALVLIWILLALFFAFSTNLNYLGLYRFYRDRLMEAFMPTAASMKGWETAYSDADRYSIASLWPQKAEESEKNRQHPYPIFNTTAIMVNDTDPTLFERGGDNFIFSPLYVGSASTGWQRTTDYIGSKNPVTLPTAMAASGAAVNSNAAYIGEGATRERLVSIAMMLMNLRLGWWFARPNTKPRRPNHIVPGFWAGVLRRGYQSDSNFVELSDGGNFDNLGLYELVRRRLKIILIVDGEEDEASAMPALVSVAQRVREDFGVILNLDSRVDGLMPLPGSGFPLDVPFSKTTYFTARIDYPGREPGILIYLKARMIEDLDFIVRGYRAKNRNFPNEPTMNQFFEPEQFEAYRTLGFVAMERLLRELELKGGLPLANALLKTCDIEPRQ